MRWCLGITSDLPIQNVQKEEVKEVRTLENFNINDIEIVGLEEIKPEPVVTPINEDAIRHSLEDEFADEIKSLKSISDSDKAEEEEMHFELKIAKEDTKFGLSFQEVEEILISEEFKSLSNVNIQGLMGMASFTDDEKIVRAEFKTLKNYFNNLKIHNSTNFNPTIISMGMSGDYKLAIDSGSTMIRVGSRIFGTRNYSN